MSEVVVCFAKTDVDLLLSTSLAGHLELYILQISPFPRQGVFQLSGVMTLAFPQPWTLESSLVEVYECIMKH